MKINYLPVLAKNSASSIRTINTSCKASISSGQSLIGLNLLMDPLTLPYHQKKKKKIDGVSHLKTPVTLISSLVIKLTIIEIRG